MMNNRAVSIMPETALYDQMSRPLQDLRVSVIDRCNLRCPYCMPQEEYGHFYQFLNSCEWLSFDEIETLVRSCVDLGVKKVRLTGGEPLLRPNLPELIFKLKAIEGVEDLSLTTNGVLLSRIALHLKRAGLDRLTVSLDSLDEKVFKSMSGGRGEIKNVLESIDVASKAGFVSLKINCVVQRGVNDHTVFDMIEHFRGSGHILRFIEYMDVGNQNHWDYKYVVPTSELVRRIHQRFPLRILEKSYSSETSDRYELIDGSVEIGFISSVTKAFCGACSRLRLSADGKFYTCLFADKGVDMRPLLRAQQREDVEAVIQEIWKARANQYSQIRSQIRSNHSPLHKVEMFQIGG